MSKRISLQRHRLIINKLRRTPCSFEQLRDFLEYESELSEDYLSCSLRTFQRDVQEIEQLYHIVINYNPSLRAYEIVEDENEVHNERLMEAFEVYNALDMSSSLRNNVILEQRKALGTEHLHGLLHAIRNNREINFRYRSYYDDSVTTRRVQPVAIKEARNRWYLLARDKKDMIFKSFGLDRLERLEISSKKFETPNYDPAAEYRYAFGIINGTGEKVCEVQLSFTPREGRYIKSLPLHHSQQLLKETEQESIFGYKLIPTYDFRQEILSYGDQVKVLKPESLKKEIVAQLSSTLSRYNE